MSVIVRAEVSDMRISAEMPPEVTVRGGDGLVPIFGNTSPGQMVDIARTEAEDAVRRALDANPANDPGDLDLPDFTLLFNNALI